MPTYRIETSHGTFDIEADRAPTEAEALAAIEGHAEAAAPQDPLKAKLQSMAPTGEDAALLDRQNPSGQRMPGEEWMNKEMVPELAAQAAMLPFAGARAATLLGRMGIGALAGATHAQAKSLARDGELAGAGQTAGEAAVSAVGVPVVEGAAAGLGRIFGKVSPEAMAKIQSMMLNNEGKDASLAAIRKHGEVAVVPSSVDPSIMKKIKESMAGIQNVEAGVAKANAPTFNAIGRKEASIPANVTLSKEESFNNARKVIGDSYQKTRAAGLGDYLDEWRSAKTKLKAAEEAMPGGKYTVEKGAKIDAAQKAFDDAEAMLDMALKDAGDPAVVAEVVAAKKAFAKNYDVQDAVAPGTDNVMPAVLSQMLKQRGDAGLSGGLNDIAKFNNNFGRSAKNPAKLATAPGAASAATAVVAGAGNPVKTAVMTGGIPMIRGALRDSIVAAGKKAVPVYPTAARSFDPEDVQKAVAYIRAMTAAAASRNR